MAGEETAKWREYLEDAASAAKDRKRSKGASDAVTVSQPAKNPLLMNLTPTMYVSRRAVVTQSHSLSVVPHPHPPPPHPSPSLARPDPLAEPHRVVCVGYGGD